jgi:hypothetical protein
MMSTSFRIQLACLAWLLIGASAVHRSAAQVFISEIRIDQPGADVDEYVEINGPPGFDLHSLTYLVIGDGAGGSGVVEMEHELAGMVIPSDGFALIAESSFSLGSIPDRVASLNFENGDNVTHLLVSGYEAGPGVDLDADDDGVLDEHTWSAIEDCVAIIDDSTSGDQTYCSTAVGPDGGSAPFHVFRDGGWQIGARDPTVGADTPGAAPSGLPIKVDDFQALVDGASLRLRWRALGELDITAFRVTRRGHDADETIGWVDIVDDGLTSRRFEMEVRRLEVGEHRIELYCVYADGTEARMGSIRVEVPAHRRFHLAPPFPNPTTAFTKVTVHSSVRGDLLDVSIMDVMGRQLATVFSGEIVTDGRLVVDATLEDLPRGVYFLVASVSGQRQARPIVKL